MVGQMSDTVIVESNYKSSWLSPGWVCWNKYSEAMLRALEKKILSIVRTAYRGFYVDIGPVVNSADKIWTISFNTDSTKKPLVLLHGLGAGVALWCLNLDALAAQRPVYAIDILGFGRSSRPAFSSDGKEAEQQLVRSIEEWRREMKLESFILLGHSMGGFLATSYAINYPDRVEHLILADPWGFPEKPPEDRRKILPWYVRVIALALRPFNPLAGLRAAGPFGPWVVSTVRADITQKYSEDLTEGTLISQYIYQCNSQTPSGESAFRSMMFGFGWAKNPMVRRIHELRKDIPITLMYGTRSWIDNTAAEILKEQRMESYVNVLAVPGAGHHVYADKPQIFNQWVNDACTMADTDEHLKIKPSNGTSSPKIQSESEENGEIALDAKPLPLTDDVH